MRHSDFERAARRITAEAVRDTQMDMVNINTPTGRERELADYIVARLRQAGFRAYLQDVTEGRPVPSAPFPATGPD